MWTFDRYQRWMEQKTDWVRPGHERTTPAEETAKIVTAAKTGPAHPGVPATAAGTGHAASEQPEITIDEEMDLNEIAELARKIEERTR